MPNKAPAHHTRPPAARASALQRGYNYSWQQQRAAFLAEHPVCCVDGCRALASVVDHVVPHRGDWARFWDQTNWQPLCARHHSEKTARGA